MLPLGQHLLVIEFIAPGAINSLGAANVAPIVASQVQTKQPPAAIAAPTPTSGFEAGLDMSDIGHSKQDILFLGGADATHIRNITNIKTQMRNGFVFHVGYSQTADIRTFDCRDLDEPNGSLSVASQVQTKVQPEPFGSPTLPTRRPARRSKRPLPAVQPPPQGLLRQQNRLWPAIYVHLLNLSPASNCPQRLPLTAPRSCWPA